MTVTNDLSDFVCKDFSDVRFFLFRFHIRVVEGALVVAVIGGVWIVDAAVWVVAPSL